MWQSSDKESIPPGYLMPVAYLWTRTVRCKNPSCGATVPLVRQTWLRKKKGNYAALRMRNNDNDRAIRFEVVTSPTESGLGFDPTGFSTRGNATCPFCGTVADVDYIKSKGWEGRIGTQLMAAACVSAQNPRSKTYVSPDQVCEIRPDPDCLNKRLLALCESYGLSVPDEQIANMNAWSRENSLGITVHPYGIRTFGDLFHPRQLCCLIAFTGRIKASEAEMSPYFHQHKLAVLTLLACFLDRLADFSSTACVWNSLEGERTAHTFGRQALSMTWDFAEADPFNPANAGWPTAIERIIPAIESVDFQNYGTVMRGSASAISLPDQSVDAIVTDPPYYDNVPYADISDFFYVWLKRAIGHSYSEHFAASLTPKKSEAIADAGRHSGSWDVARKAYERMMADAFSQAHRCLRSFGVLAIVYAHKTTLGWATLVDALRQAGFIVTEAWPLDTEKPGRLRAQASAALASSIFVIARKREGSSTGSYEDEVRPELDKIVRERVDTLWKMGITGADLVIAAVGAGLRAFTRFSRVEYANGEEVPAEKFLAEVEGVVLETLLEKIFVGQAASLSSTGQRHVPLGSVDGPSRFYVLWRYTYKAAEMDAGEAIVFTYGQNVELDGQNGLSSGSRALVEKKKGKYRLRDFAERGDDEKLGMPDTQAGKPVPLIDTLHRILWLVGNEPRKLNQFLDEARPDRERLRLVAQALAGTALEGGNGRVIDSQRVGGYTTPKEHGALQKLLANWKMLIEKGMMPLFQK
jgi:putative DNA methylase